MEGATSPGPYGSLHLGHGTFGQAVQAMKDGKRVARSGWNGKGLFVFMQIPATISVETVVPNMQSLPQDVKDEFKRRYDAAVQNGAIPAVNAEIHYSNQMAIVDTNNNINGWAPSSSDSLATDWMVLD